MTDLIGELRSRGLVKELGPIRRPGAGRPTRPIDFDGERWGVLGVQVDIDAIGFNLSTVGGRELATAAVEVDLDRAGNESLATVSAAVRDQLGQSPDDVSLIAVAITVPGYVAADRSTVSRSESLGWHDLDLGAAIGDLLADAGRPGAFVEVGTDSQLAALHAARLELGLDSDGLVIYLGGRRQLGSGLIIGGEIFGGSFGGAGDLAHLVIDPAGPVCDCGHRGCLQLYVGLEALLVASGLRSPDEAADLVRTAPDRAVQLILDAADADETAAALAAAGSALGQAIDGVVGLINPQVVVLGGYLGSLGEQLVPAIQESLSHRLGLAAYAETSVVALDPTVPRTLNGAILAGRDACFYDPLALTRPIS